MIRITSWVVTTMFVLKAFADTEESCPDQCTSYFDGCNTCDCTNSDHPYCTSRICRESSVGTPACTKCESNLQWKECGSICVKTCDNPSPICISECYQRCECPADKPILHNGVCITYDECVPQQVAQTCPTDCSLYFDGCNYCDCNSNGSMSCTSNVCLTYSDPYCASCKNNLEWTSCGSSCTNTCTDTNVICDNVDCVSRCQCPSNKPIYHNGVCLELDECFNFQNICPTNCISYTDGCNDCTCLNGEDACTNRTCNATGVAQCTSCANNLEWTTCGSSCSKTCSNPNPTCDNSCVPGCSCPADKPILKNNTCIPYSECDCECTSIPLPNGKYVDSRTKKCNSYATEETCENTKTCLWKCK